MGSDDLHHQRKARLAKHLARRRSKRESCDRVLIVCEGSKTELNYLRDLRDSLKLSSANIEIYGNSGSSPKSVVWYAKRRLSEEKEKGDTYDKVYCVFDKDTHSSYTQAINECKKTSRAQICCAITSVPCFEYWLLLHHEYSTKPFTSAGNRSACDNLIRDLRKHLRNYSKGTKGWFNELNNRTDQAISHSEQALQAAYKHGTDNPTTRMHELVKFLLHLSDIDD